jgi:hypothetical protein
MREWRTSGLYVTNRFCDLLNQCCFEKIAVGSSWDGSGDFGVIFKHREDQNMRSGAASRN